jgi:hypothetical protein
MRQPVPSHSEKDPERLNIVDTCNMVVDQALYVFSGPGGINDQLASMSLNPALPPVSSILKLSAPLDAYEKTASVGYPVATIYCDRLKNTLAEKYRMLSGSATLVVELRVSGARVEDLDTQLNSYVQAACGVLEATRGPWTDIGTYTGTYDIKFQSAKPGGKQFTKSAHIEFDIHISR